MKFNGYICDICGQNIYITYNRLEVKETKTTAFVTNTKTLDLCGPCAKKMIQWIKDNKPNGDIRDKVVVGSEEEDYEIYDDTCEIS